MSSNLRMARRFGSLPILLLLAAVCGFVQISIGLPGQYPGGRRYPGQGSPYPGQNQAPTSSFAGMLRSISNNGSGSSASNSLVLETDDNRIITVSLERRTKYYGSTGGTAKITDFQPGDHIEVNATQDNNNGYHGVKVSLLREGTPEERAEAAKPIDGSSSRTSGNSDDDADRPRLRRAASSSADDASNSPSTPINSSVDDTVRPRVRRAAVSGGDEGPKAEITPIGQPDGPDVSTRPSTAVPRDSDDSAPPVLRRRPAGAPTGDDSAPVIAGSRPSIHAEEVNGVTRVPTGPVVSDSPAPRDGGSFANDGARIFHSGDPVIDMAREEAFSFSETLPNYVVKQFTTRFQTVGIRGRGNSWQTLDTVTADVVYQDGVESYKNILVNGRTPRESPEKTGSWSRGEFASTLQDVMSPRTNADFHGKRSTVIASRPAYLYDFSVEQPNSHWHIEANGQQYLPEYTGAIWIDKENYRVLRVELAARNMPRSFPLDQAESAVDYDYVLIGDQKYLLPVHSEALSCARGTNDCSRNVIEFRNYKKFTADTSITFDAAEKDPIQK
jgi:hypothetical protein